MEELSKILDIEMQRILEKRQYYAAQKFKKRKKAKYWGIITSAALLGVIAGYGMKQRHSDTSAFVPFEETASPDAESIESHVLKQLENDLDTPLAMEKSGHIAPENYTGNDLAGYVRHLTAQLPRVCGDPLNKANCDILSGELKKAADIRDQYLNLEQEANVLAGKDLDISATESLVIMKDELDQKIAGKKPQFGDLRFKAPDIDSLARLRARATSGKALDLEFAEFDRHFTEHIVSGQATKMADELLVEARRINYNIAGYEGVVARAQKAEAAEHWYQDTKSTFKDYCHRPLEDMSIGSLQKISDLFSQQVVPETEPRVNARKQEIADLIAMQKFRADIMSAVREGNHSGIENLLTESGKFKFSKFWPKVEPWVDRGRENLQIKSQNEEEQPHLAIPDALKKDYLSIESEFLKEPGVDVDYDPVLDFFMQSFILKAKRTPGGDAVAGKMEDLRTIYNSERRILESASRYAYSPLLSGQAKPKDIEAKLEQCSMPQARILLRLVQSRTEASEYYQGLLNVRDIALHTPRKISAKQREYIEKECPDGPWSREVKHMRQHARQDLYLSASIDDMGPDRLRSEAYHTGYSDWYEALILYQAIERKGGLTQDLASNIAVLYMAHGALEYGREYIEKKTSPEMGNNDAQMYNNLAYYFFKNNNPGKAEDYLDMALEARPGYQIAINNKKVLDEIWHSTAQINPAFRLHEVRILAMQDDQFQLDTRLRR